MKKAAVLTISDSRSANIAEDKSGPLAVEALRPLGCESCNYEIIPDDVGNISARISELINKVDLILTTGGTGIGPRDVTPEAINPLLEKPLPGFGEMMRTGTYSKTPLSIISRGGAGISGKTLIVMLPGSPRAVRECMELLGPAIKHVLKVLSVGKLDCAGEMPA